MTKCFECIMRIETSWGRYCERESKRVNYECIFVRIYVRVFVYVT